MKRRCQRSACRATREDRSDLMQEVDRHIAFLMLIGAWTRYETWRMSGVEPGVLLPRSPETGGKHGA